MKAAVLHAPGDLRVEQAPMPAALADDEVLVRVMAAGICGSDIGRVMVTGTYRFPTIPGHEFSGRVEATGPGVASVSPGDRVAVAPLLPCMRCEECEGGNYSLCDDYGFLGSRTDGGFAEYVKAPARNLLRLPDNVGYDAAATIEPAAIVLHGVRKVGLTLGDAVAVVGCGALGFFAVQFAKLAGAHPIVAVDVDDDKLALARQVGADSCVNPLHEDAVRAIHAVTRGKGVRIAIEAAGANRGRELAILVAAKRGRVLLYGSAHGDVVFAGKLFEQIVRREIAIIGSWNSYSVPFPGKEWLDIRELLREERLIVSPIVTHRLELEEAPAVFQRLQNRDFGAYHKILFAPNG